MNNITRRLVSSKPDDPISFLGPLETSILEIIWRLGDATVRDIVEHLNQGDDPPRAYTTAMTTLDRLYKKSILRRTKVDRAFYYSPALTKVEFEKKNAETVIAGLLASTSVSNGLLLSCLLDAVGRHEPSILDELEEQIKKRKQELDAE